MPEVTFEERAAKLLEYWENKPIGARKLRRLRRIYRLVRTGGVIPNQSDYRFLDELSPPGEKPLNYCQHMGPTGKCKIGLGNIRTDRCPHRAKHERGEQKCREYEPDAGITSRFEK